jgi:hypothetical protein
LFDCVFVYPLLIHSRYFIITFGNIIYILFVLL